MRMPLVLFFSILFALASCIESKSNMNSSEIDTSISSTRSSQEFLDYDFNNPEIIVLDKELMEISGLAYVPSTDVLLAHNDEKGHVYTISKSDGSILKDNKFGKKGDYESIEIIGDEYVICTSSGRLHFYNPESDKTRLIKTDLSQKNDVEGMCLSSNRKYLLLACKGQANEESKTKKLKAVHAYSLESKLLLEGPYLNIKDNELVKKVEYNNSSASKSKLKKLINRIKEFAPSGIAIHPSSDDHYLISARGSSLVVYDKDKSLKEVIFLNDKLIKQPEGICFDGDAQLYISNEGRGLSAKIFKFSKN